MKFVTILALPLAFLAGATAANAAAGDFAQTKSDQPAATMPAPKGEHDGHQETLEKRDHDKIWALLTARTDIDAVHRTLIEHIRPDRDPSLADYLRGQLAKERIRAQLITDKAGFAQTYADELAAVAQAMRAAAQQGDLNPAQIQLLRNAAAPMVEEGTKYDAVDLRPIKAHFAMTDEEAAAAGYPCEAATIARIDAKTENAVEREMVRAAIIAYRDSAADARTRKTAHALHVAAGQDCDDCPECTDCSECAEGTCSDAAHKQAKNVHCVDCPDEATA
ncbi:MAG: hypothetical protein EBR34_08655 [Sphingomonadaceae bacterium]|nr:hypothetical protein [Sphingomonadaceae bacterium]